MFYLERLFVKLWWLTIKSDLTLQNCSSLIFAPIEISRTIAWMQRNKNTKSKPITIVVGFCFGSPSWTRTNDTAVNSRVLYRLSYGGILKPTKQSLIGYLCRHRPIFPGRFQPSIFGTNELNYRVRNGNGWTLIVINTDYISKNWFLTI